MSARKPPRNGSVASQDSVPRLSARTAKLIPLLKEVYNAYQKRRGPDTNARCRWNFAFHMTDWAHDLRALADLYAHPERYDAETAAGIVYGFLIHALPHLQAAARNIGVKAPDTFDEADQKTAGRL